MHLRKSKLSNMNLRLIIIFDKNIEFKKKGGHNEPPPIN